MWGERHSLYLSHSTSTYGTPSLPKSTDAEPCYSFAKLGRRARVTYAPVAKRAAVLMQSSASTTRSNAVKKSRSSKQVDQPQPAPRPSASSELAARVVAAGGVCTERRPGLPGTGVAESGGVNVPARVAVAVVEV